MRADHVSLCNRYNDDQTPMTDRPFYIHGCSHASGAELPGDSGDGLVRNMSWCNQTAQQLGFTRVVNHAVPCSSNPYIIKETMKWCAENYTQDPFVLISWTGTDRLYMQAERQKNRNRDSVIRLTPGCLSNPPREAAPELVQMYRELLLTEWGDWRAIQTRFLQEILVLQTFLDKLKLKYLFVTSITPLDSWITQREQPQAAIRQMLNTKRMYRGFSQDHDGVYWQSCLKRFPDEVAPNQHIGPQGQLWYSHEITDYLTKQNLL